MSVCVQPSEMCIQHLFSYFHLLEKGKKKNNSEKGLYCKDQTTALNDATEETNTHTLDLYLTGTLLQTAWFWQ